MKLPLSRLFLVCLYIDSSSSVSSGIPVLTQTPLVSATVGENVTITCCWTGELERGTINWWKNQTKVKSDIFIYDVTKESLQKTSSCSDFYFPKVTKADSGRYTCELLVEIPYLAQVIGSGTVLTVRDREPKYNTYDNSDDSGHQTEDVPRSSDNVGLHLLRCLPLLALIVSFFCLNYWGTKVLKQKTEAAGNAVPSGQGTEEEEGGEEGGEEQGEEGGEEEGEEAEGGNVE